MNRILWIMLLSPFAVIGQGVQVEYDKNRDFSIYRTFSFGESEVITPKDQRQVSEATLKTWVEKSIERELTGKGLQRVDSAADLIVSFVAGSQERSDMEMLGPLGMTPGSNAQTWSRDYRMGNLIIDLDDRSKHLIWRITAVSNSSSASGQQMIDEVVTTGFKKFSIKPKKSKKK